jgi:hypothetical protein
LKAGAIVGIAVGAAIVIAAIIVIVVCKLRKGGDRDYDAGNVQSAINPDADASPSATIWGGDGGGSLEDPYKGGHEQDDPFGGVGYEQDDGLWA